MRPDDKRRQTAAHELKEHRALLVESVRRYVLPGFIQLGFEVTKARGSSDHIFPLGHLGRERPDRTVDLAEIQFMTYRRAAFRINLCAVPREGIMTLGGRRSADETDAGGLHDHFEMYASPRWRLWFSLRFWRLRKPKEAEYENLAQSVVAMPPEVESALRDGKVGPHMRKITYPDPGRA
jgi:hypothetical protein